MGRLILIGGGARSGKSDFALSLARSLGSRRLFLATAEARDDEMADRIRRHQEHRGNDFTTVEEPLAVTAALSRHQAYDVLVLDCLTLWISNLLLAGTESEKILGKVDELLAHVRAAGVHGVIITNEVGMGLVPETALGRTFRDVAGLAHQRLSQAADEVYFAVLGTMLRIKPAPAFVAHQPDAQARER
jgi:adenosylcobinamide kinase / adenosylcobinamide-phosphate guanylyltransferase